MLSKEQTNRIRNFFGEKDVATKWGEKVLIGSHEKSNFVSEEILKVKKLKLLVVTAWFWLNKN